MKANDTIADIIEYLEAPDRPFALLLEGPWGCGKTRFVQHELTKALERLKKPFVVIRASMIGVTSSADIYSRIVTAAICDTADIQDDIGGERRKAVKKAAQELGLSYLKKQAGKILDATDLNYSPSSDLVAAMVLPRRSLLVLDDVERVGEMDELEFFGAVANLVEKQGRKVLLVHGSEGKKLGEEITEKLVWKRYDFSPDFESACESVFFDAIEACPFLLAKDAVVKGVEASEVLNVRSLIRSKPAVAAVFGSSYAADSGIDQLSQHRTLTDAVERIVRMVSGTLPARPVDLGVETSFSESLSYHTGLETWRRSNALHCLDVLVTDVSLLDDKVLSETLRDYGATYHPSSAVEEEALRFADSVKYGLMDDQEADAAVAAICGALMEHDACIGNIPRLIGALSLLKDWGIASNREWKEAIQGAEEIVLKCPEESVRIIQSDEYGWHDMPFRFGREIPELALIAQRAEAEYIRMAEAKAAEALADCDEDGAATLAGRLSIVHGLNPGAFVEWNPVSVANVVCSSSAKSISEFRKWIMSFENDCLLAEDKSQDVSDWFVALGDAINVERVPGKMAKMQVGYLKKNIATVAERLGGKGGDSGK